ncbi:hypothetical protein BH09PSE6_BH09PSE6_21140 [soil metagenome]
MNRLPRLLLASTLVGLATSALAADPPAERRMGTREELRACLDQKDQLDERQRDLQPQVTSSETAVADVSTQQDELNASEAKLDRKDRKAVAAFNAKLAEVNKEIDQANARADKVNAAQQALHTEQMKYYQHCATNTYRTWDEEAVRKERQSQSK